MRLTLTTCGVVVLLAFGWLGLPQPNLAAQAGRPLRSVFHDSSLAGDGDGVPLRIAPGGVTSAHLSTPTAPTSGQLLGFDGTNLAWQNAGAGAEVLKVSYFDLQPIDDGFGRRVFLIPQIIEQRGAVDDPADRAGSDAQISIQNASGVAGLRVQGDGSLDVTLFLFDDATGLPMTGVAGEVCPAGCMFHINAGEHLTIGIEHLANNNAGGLSNPLSTIHGILKVSGPGDQRYALQGVVVSPN